MCFNFLFYFSEGFLLIYLFNSIARDGLNSINSSLVFAVSYLPTILFSKLISNYFIKYSNKVILNSLITLRIILCISVYYFFPSQKILTTLLYVFFMEFLWYYAAPIIDKMQSEIYDNLNMTKPESLLQVIIQISLFFSLFLGGYLADKLDSNVLLLLTAVLHILCLVISSGITHSNEDIKKSQENFIYRTETKNSSFPIELFVLGGIITAFPQILNILLPLKIFNVFGDSASLGFIDGLYSIGALCASVFGGFILIKSRYNRRMETILIVLICFAVLTFSLSNTIFFSALVYFVLGVLISLMKIRIRSEIFKTSKKYESVFFQDYTRFTLIIALISCLLTGIFGHFFNYASGYLVIILGAIISLYIVNKNRRDDTELL